MMYVCVCMPGISFQPPAPSLISDVVPANMKALDRRCSVVFHSHPNEVLDLTLAGEVEAAGKIVRVGADSGTP